MELGLKAAAEVRKQFPVIQDGAIVEYLQTLGARLVAAAPADLNRKEFRYSFTPVNVKEINAFALPGGPMFVNRGMFEAAATEGEVVGVMAHELSHVLLRHGTANATKAENPWLQLGQLAGAVGGAIVGGGLGEAISTGTGFGLGALMLRYSRDFEKQADLLGSQIMARAGYDPRDLGRMFETIERASGGGAPQWMSSHPNPGNRTKYIAEEAAKLTIAARPDSRGFQAAKTRFSSLPAAESMADIEKRAKPGAGDGSPSVGTPGRPVPAPSTEFTELSGGNVFQANVPDNWTKMSSKTAIRVVPENGYGDVNGQSVFTHGVEFGVTRAASRDLTEATQCISSGVRPEQSRSPDRGAAADDAGVGADGAVRAAAESVGTRRTGACVGDHRVSGGRHALLLHDDRAGEGRGGVRTGVPEDRAVDQIDGSALSCLFVVTRL